VGELDDRLNSILSSPEDMKKIMDLAKSLSGTSGGTAPASPHSENNNHGGTPSAGDIDPELIKLMNRIISEFLEQKNDKTLLLSNIKPYLRADRQAKIDKAVKIARIAYIAKSALTEFNGGGLNL